MNRLPLVVAMTAVSLFVICVVAVPFGIGAEEAGPVQVSTYAPPSLFTPHLALMTQSAVKPQDSWEALKAQFVEDEPAPLPVLDPLVRTRSAADASLFTVAELANRLSNLLELRYSNGQLHRAANVVAQPPSTRWHATPLHLEDVRLKFDIRLANTGPYLGFRIVFPFGG
jgi:hypothetical protein